MFTARFDVPAAVRPLDIRAATLVLDINALGRPVTIRLVQDGRRTDLTTLQGPDGPQRIALPLDAVTGPVDSLTLSVDIADLSDPTKGIESQSAMWKINQMGLELRGVVGRR